MNSTIREGMKYARAVYGAASKRACAEGGLVQPHAEGRWLWVPTRRWVEDGSTHPRDTDGDPA